MGRKVRNAVVVLLLGLAPPAGAQQAPALVDAIAAQVGTEVILVSEVNRLTDPIVAEMQQLGAPPEEVARLRAEALESLIERKLVALVARRNEVTASEAEVDEAIRAIAQENGFSLETLRSSVEAQGLPWVAYRDRIAQEIVHQKIIGGMVRSRAHADPEAVERLYLERYGDQQSGGTEIYLRHLVVPAVEGKQENLPAACREANLALRRIRGGEPFLEVAARVSAVPPDLGWIHKESLAAWMIQVIDSLEPGQVSEVIELPFGCNVLQLVETREFVPLTFEQAKPALEQELAQIAMEEEYRQFIERVRAQTYIERRGLYAEAARIDLSRPTDPKAAEDPAAQ